MIPWLRHLLAWTLYVLTFPIVLLIFCGAVIASLFIGMDRADAGGEQLCKDLDGAIAWIHGGKNQ